MAFDEVDSATWSWIGDVAGTCQAGAERDVDVFAVRECRIWLALWETAAIEKRHITGHNSAPVITGSVFGVAGIIHFAGGVSSPPDGFQPK